MRYNPAMKELLAAQGVVPETVEPVDEYPIWQKRDQGGRPYWGVSHFWKLDQGGVSGDCDLSRLEWDGNEVQLDAASPAELPGTLRKAIGVMKGWKRTLERNFPDTAFLIFASCDDGAALVNREDFPDGGFSVTLRFWACRAGAPVLSFEAFDEWEQPSLLERCDPLAGPGAD